IRRAYTVRYSAIPGEYFEQDRFCENCRAQPSLFFLTTPAVLLWESAQPAYAEGFRVAGAHMSRRSESQGGTSNSESYRAGPIQSAHSAVRCSVLDACVQLHWQHEPLISKHQ